MLSPSQRTTILELNTQGVSERQIARVLGVSRLAVRRVPGQLQGGNARPIDPLLKESFETRISVAAA